MGVLVTICFAVAALLAGLAAVYAPPAPPRFNPVAGALAFLCLGFTLMRLLGG